MAIHYNQRARKVTGSDIASITLYNVTMTKNVDEQEGFVFEGYHTATGCGGADSGILILLKDTIPWTKMCFKWEGTGTASCWSYCVSAHGASTGTPNGNMLSYSEGSGDRVSDCYLTYDVTTFQTHDKQQACDNATDNFFISNGGVYRRFRMTRRRNVNGQLAGIHHGRSCNSAGTGSVTRISEIFIW